MEQYLKNRLWIFINYTALICLLIVFYTGKFTGWPVTLIVLEAATVLIFLYSFLRGFLHTGYWKLVHTSHHRLDEREVQVVLEAVRYAYGTFTIIAVVLIYAFALAQFHPIDVVLAGGLLYLAHTLPAAIAGCSEKIIIEEPEA